MQKPEFPVWLEAKVEAKGTIERFLMASYERAFANWQKTPKWRVIRRLHTRYEWGLMLRMASWAMHWEDPDVTRYFKGEEAG